MTADLTREMPVSQAAIDTYKSAIQGTCCVTATQSEEMHQGTSINSEEFITSDFTIFHSESEQDANIYPLVLL